MNSLAKFLKILDRIYDVMFFLAGLLLAATVAIISYEVFFRYFLRRPTIWVVDVCRYILVYATFLAASRCLKRDEHIIIDFVLVRVNPRIQGLLNTFTSILGALTCLTLFLFSSATTWEHFRRGLLVVDPIEIPKFIPLATIPIGALFLFIVFVSKTFNYLYSLGNVGKKMGKD